MRIKDKETRANFLELGFPLFDSMGDLLMKLNLKSKLSRNNVRLTDPRAGLYYFLKREKTLPVISS